MNREDEKEEEDVMIMKIKKIRVKLNINVETHLFIIWIYPSRYHMNLFCRNFSIFKNKLSGFFYILYVVVLFVLRFNWYCSCSYCWCCWCYCYETASVCNCWWFCTRRLLYLLVFLRLFSSSLDLYKSKWILSFFLFFLLFSFLFFLNMCFTFLLTLLSAVTRCYRYRYWMYISV